MSFFPVLVLAALSSGQLHNLAPGQRVIVPIEGLKAGEAYRIGVNLEGPILEGDRVRVELTGPGSFVLRKNLHAGDPDLHMPFRPSIDGSANLNIGAEPGSKVVKVRTSWSRTPIEPDDRPAIEAEPNDSWREANPLILGRAVFGTADDVDYLDNPEEGKAGIDWFRLDIADEKPVLVFFQLELLDRDVSANLRLHRLEPSGDQIKLDESGKDPMEIVHDRERERYSTHLSRTLTKGTYFVEVNANHPDYILRTRTNPIPPYRNPEQAVETGLDYLLQIGDAWFAQIPREGNIFTRANNLHDTATRCTACHASSFPTEASLIAHAAGYPIRAKSSMLYLMDRLANSPTPLYGNDGLYWQRFIAIPLQAQGKQGGIVLDFENEVLGRKTPEFERFGPFLQAAWRGRRTLPADEVNGVIPLDSKFGFAWRDWRVLDEMTRRTGRVAYAAAADAIADILGDPATNLQVETLQDRIHRLHAWTLIDKARFASRIKVEAEALFALQNPDGGWHELDRKPGPSAVYTTGQLVWTLLKAEYTRDDPRIARALHYLLAQQQPFGGWFQTTTHENFRTPMRETRYAVEALAEAFPRPGAPVKGWGNRDDQPARIPRPGSMVATLDDLENLWEVPEADRSRYALAIIPWLDHPEPIVRGRAAACLGRLGDPSAVKPLIGLLGDPSKIVWRSAAWALRRLGNQGLGIESIKQALASPDPAVRRGASRIFAYQFSGMDGQLDLANLLIERTADPDLWTRLQALRTLRQWFYRTNDANLRRKIVEAYLIGMSRPDLPVIRKALSEGMYILLDENLGGGVSLQKNLAALPEKFRRNALKGREDVEREILLGPILAALETGNDLQREALLRSFDGSFFKGRTYARQPSGMLDVGNDREFGFLHEPPSTVLDRTFEALLNAGSTPEIRCRSIQLASFFLIPGRTEDPSIQAGILRGMTDPDASVRAAARAAITHDLALRGAESYPKSVALILEGLRGQDQDRRVISRAIARNPALRSRPEIVAEIRKLLESDQAASILPLLGHPSISDADLLASLIKTWPGASDPADRLAILEILFARPTLIDVEEPPRAVVELLKFAIQDRSETVRERILETIGSLERLGSGKHATSLLLVSLADDSPAIRRQALRLTTNRTQFWGRTDATERLLALLIDPDARVRDEALAVVERNRLAVDSPKLARRVKALANDPDLKVRADAALVSQGFDPKAVEADVAPGRPRLPGLASFRKNVNPLFYQPGEDGTSCARCHATHNVLRISERDPALSGNEDEMLVNYRSALKVVNLGEPESSLLLRKPRSQPGQGGPDVSSPTGLTHVGGPRWESVKHPAYRAILEWIREASKVETGSPK
jgi:cellulose synthase operon protein C